MKALSLLISTTAFLIAGYFFIAGFAFSEGLNHIIYMSLLFILMLICVVGIMINVPMIMSERRKMKALVYNQIAKKTMKSKNLQWNLETT